MLIHVQQHTCPATYLSSKKVTPVYNAHTCQATYMCSGRMKKIRYDSTVFRTQAHGIESRFVVRLCAKTHFRSHTWHTCPAKFKPNRTSICWTCMLLDKYVAGLYEHCKRCCWTSMLLDMYEHCKRGFTIYNRNCAEQLKYWKNALIFFSILALNEYTANVRGRFTARLVAQSANKEEIKRGQWFAVC